MNKEIKICDLFVKEGRLLMKKKIELIHNGYSEKEACNCLYAFCPNIMAMHYAKIVKVPDEHIYMCPQSIYNNCKNNEAKNNKYYDWLVEKVKELNMKFDYVVQNPPYDGILYLKFYKLAKKVCPTGEVTLIGPSNWHISLKKCSGNRGNEKYYNEVKELYGGHISEISLENLNKTFNTQSTSPLFSIIKIDNGKNFNTIKFNCAGVTKIVKNINDCNIVLSDYDIVWGIINKALKVFNPMRSRIYTKKSIVNDNTYYLKCSDIGNSLVPTEERKMKYNDSFIDICGCKYFIAAITFAMHSFDNEIQNCVPKSLANGSTRKSIRYTNSEATCLYGTKEELENYKYSVLNNELPLFINLVFAIDQHNNIKDVMPLIMDRKYTDCELYDICGFSEEERKTIHMVCELLKKDSPYYQRLVFGPENIDSSLVNNYVEKISN